MNRLMIIPIFDTVILPEVKYQFGSFALSDQEKERLRADEMCAVLLPLKKMAEWPEITPEDFYDVGVIARIDDVTDFMSISKLDSEAKDKVRVTDIRIEGHLIDGEIEIVKDVVDVNEEGQSLLRNTLLKVADEIARYFKGGESAMTSLENCKTMNELISMFGQFIGMTVEEKFALLETDSYRERGSLITEALIRFKGSIELQADLTRKYGDSQNGVYREAAIRRQIEVLQAELDEIHPEDAEQDTFEQKIEACGMPEEVKTEVMKDLKRFRLKQPNDPEYSTLYDYLDYITDLAWTVEEQKPADIKKARKILDRDHYGMEKVKDRILQQLAVMSLTGKQSGTILLLVGAPGTGKTSIGRGVAEALGRKFARISLGGVRDEAQIRGHRRTYIGAMAGRIIDGIGKTHVMNPVVVLDEVDKLSSSYQGDPSSALLEVLDPEQNSTFTDHYLNVPYDLSHVFFLCTANTTDTIPQPLLDRMEVISLPGYTPADKFQIGRKHLLGKARAEVGLEPSALKVTDKALEKIIAEYTMEAGVRGLKKQLDILCRKAATKIVEDALDKITIGVSDVEEYLGKPKLRHDKILKEMTPGIVTGLAWTQAGGEILFIETAAMKGSGQMVLTGQLGDVMKESATIAMSLARELFGDKGLHFKESDIHIHVPAGAVPKDGPSAGITMFTALVSLITGKTAPPDLAMTGELSLSGRVLPIGGLPEKLIAAHRAGVRHVLIPEDNVQDLDEVPEEIKDSLQITPVRSAKEVIRLALGIKNLPAPRREAFDDMLQDKEEGKNSPRVIPRV